MCRDVDDTERAMMRLLDVDPIAGFFGRYCKVNYEPITIKNIVDARQHFPDVKREIDRGNIIRHKTVKARFA